MKKLDMKTLRALVLEEMGKFGPQENPEDLAKDTEEVEADEYADTLEKHINYMKALKVEEARLQKRLSKIAEQRIAAKKKFSGR